jgi:MEMO1 family protein
VQTATRQPAVAGAFYPADPKALRREVEALLADAAGFFEAAALAAPPKALICPHAGYVYSGPVAARAYRLLAPARERIRRVVLLGPAHRAAVRGLAIPTVAAFRTPLGDIPLDAEGRARMLGLPQVVADDKAHAFEHSLEVQLPFLQNMLDSFVLLPLAVGAATPEAVGEVLDAAWGGPETLVVISSDLSHYLSYEAAQEADRASIERILAGRVLDHAQACGATPINGLLLSARRRNLQPVLLTCAIRATPPATARGSSATPRSPSPKRLGLRCA